MPQAMPCSWSSFVRPTLFHFFSEKETKPVAFFQQRFLQFLLIYLQNFNCSKNNSVDEAKGVVLFWNLYCHCCHQRDCSNAAAFYPSLDYAAIFSLHIHDFYVAANANICSQQVLGYKTSSIKIPSMTLFQPDSKAQVFTFLTLRCRFTKFLGAGSVLF